MTRRLLGLAIGVLVAATAAVACDLAGSAPLQRLVIATGTVDSVDDRLGQALVSAAQDRWGIDAQVHPSAGSVESLRLVVAGEADVAFTTVDVAAAALHGDAPFSGVAPIAALAGVYDDYLHVVVRADSAIERLADLSGQRVSIGPTDSGMEMVATRILEAAGEGLSSIVRSQLDPVAAAAALLSGEIDAFFVAGGLPTPAVADLAARLPIRLLSMADEVDEIQRRQGELYLARSIPASTYGFDREVETLGVRTVLVVRTDMPEPVAHWLTGLLFAAKPQMVAAHQEARRLDRRSAVAIFPLPLHEGAARYYRESKPMALPVRQQER